jgi:hypothetical protein
VGSVVGVEKVHFPQNSQNLGDRKSLGKPRKSFVWHPGAILFRQFPGKEFFNSHGEYHPANLCSLPERRAGGWFWTRANRERRDDSRQGTTVVNLPG